MTDPPKPARTVEGAHAPGISKTLEENAEHARERAKAAREASVIRGGPAGAAENEQEENEK